MLVSVIALFYIAILGKDILAPMLFGLLFSVLLLPVAKILEKRLRLHRSLAAFLSVLLLVIFAAGILYIISSQFRGMRGDMPEYKRQLQASMEDLQQWVFRIFHVNLTIQNNYMNVTATKIFADGPAMISSTIRSISFTLIFVLLILIDTFFLLFYRSLIVRFIIAVFKEENSEVVKDIIAQVQHGIGQYVQGLLLEMVIVSSVCCLALWILGIDYPVLLGLLTGLLNFIPYIGIFISLLLTIVVVFATAGLGKILLVIVVLFGIHLLDANVLLPFIVGAKVRLNALISIMGVIIGGSIWGISGAFLAIPVIAILKIIFDRINSLKPWGILLGDGRIDMKV